MKGNVIQMNTLHLNSVRLNGIGKVQSVSLKGGSTEDPVFPPVEPPIEPEPTPTYTLSASVTNGKVSATLNGSAVTLPYTANEGDTIVVEVTPNDGYTFEGWADGNTDNPRSITMNADVALSAQCVEVVVPPVGKYIQFEDKAVEAICVENWSSDGIGLTEEDAAAVTSIGTKFKSNTEITSFNEFEYFTGVKKFEAQAFASCSSLRSIRLHAGITEIEMQTFMECTALSSINLEHISKIYKTAFYKCNLSGALSLPSLTYIAHAVFYNNNFTSVDDLGAITTITGYDNAGDSPIFAGNPVESIALPATLETIGWRAFYNYSTLQKIICRATTPPTLDNVNAFTNTNNCPIYVPDASLEAYKTATNWVSYADRIHPLSEIEGSLVFYDKLVGDGTAYINTEYYPKGTDTFDYDVTPKTTNAKFVWGVKSNSISLGELLYTKDSSYFLYGPTAARDIGVANVGRLQRQMRVTLSDGQYFRVISAGDTLVNLAQGTGNYFSATAENPLLLFACQQKAGTGSYPDTRRSDGALWSFKITDIDGNTIMSLKPCTFAGEAGMWDEVNGKFYGNAAASGEFSVANDE